MPIGMPSRMWRAFNRLTEDCRAGGKSTQLWLEGFYNNRIFDLFVNQTYTVISNEVLTAIPLFLFMGYIVERANIVDKLFSTLAIATRKTARIARCRRPHHLRAFCDRDGHRRCGRDAHGPARAAADAQDALRPQLCHGHHLRRRHARHPYPAVDHAYRLCRGLGRVDRAALRGRAAARPRSGWPLPDLYRRPRHP